MIYFFLFIIFLAQSFLSYSSSSNAQNDSYIAIQDKEAVLNQPKNISVPKKNPRKRMTRKKELIPSASQPDSRKIIIETKPLTSAAGPINTRTAESTLIINSPQPVTTPTTPPTSLTKEKMNKRTQDTITLSPTITTVINALPTESPTASDTASVSSSRPPIDTNKRTITVTNNVTKKMRTYKHWGTSHEPTFTLRANGKVVPQDEQISVEITDNKLDMNYHADFYGMRTSNDSASFIIDKDANAVNVTFSWDKKPRIILDKGTPQ